MEVHIFPRDICPKVNVIAQVEFELVYCNIAVLHVSHYVTETPQSSFPENFS